MSATSLLYLLENQCLNDPSITETSTGSEEWEIHRNLLNLSSFTSLCSLFRHHMQEESCFLQLTSLESDLLPPVYLSLEPEYTVH